MSVNYKESTVAGTEYVRCCSVRIVNPADRTPAIMFDEEKATVFPNRTIYEADGTIVVSFDPSRVISIKDPTTGLPTGQTTTYGEIYVAIYSAWQQEAEVRDNAPPEAI